MTILAGIFLFIAGLSLLAREVLLSSAGKNYPTAPWWVRYSMFWFGGVFIAYGSIVITGRDPHITSGSVGIFFVVAAYNALLLVNIIRQRGINEPATKRTPKLS